MSIPSAFVLGGPEILVILFLLAVPVGIVLLILFIVNKTQRPGLMPPIAPATPEQRLRELDALKTQNLISDEEYETKRQEILGEV